MRAILGPLRAEALLAVVTLHETGHDEAEPSRAAIADGLFLLLYDDLCARVESARAYAEDARREGRALVLDHGALRTVRLAGTGTLPAGEEAFTRVLLPLGYRLAGTYPLDRLGMTGRAYAHLDRPETIPQYFVSELHPERFSVAFRGAVARTLASSRDPLDPESRDALDRLARDWSLPFEQAAQLLPRLARCFGRHHALPSAADYELLLAESPEMAWIATEGNVFNHATDRVEDVEQVAAAERAKGRPMKARVEIGSGGRVRQTAFRAEPVARTFATPDGAVTREVPGSFFELIQRAPLESGRLDLSFDVGNATGIFAMTKSVGAASSEAGALLTTCGAEPRPGALVVRSPIDGSILGSVAPTSGAELDTILGGADEAFRALRSVPAPARGAIVHAFGQLVRARADALARLITLEVGKIPSEARGEVQEVIDVCDFAVGLSRQLHGLTIASERPDHRLAETWHPLGVCSVITAFNFPIAVYAWNAALALVCGDPVVWKPSERTPLVAEALLALLRRAIREAGHDPRLAAIVHGDASIGRALVDDARVRLVSATGSTAMGRDVALRAAPTFKRTLLELGGNNGAIVAPSASLDLALRAIVFSAVGTAGQRCTTLRRLFVHERLVDDLLARLRAAYDSLPIGDPREDGVLVGPLHHAAAFDAMQAALAEARTLGASVHGGERVLAERFPDAWYARPALVRMPAQVGPMLRETFAPILYVVPYASLDDALAMHAATSHGLSSSLFTNDLREAELFLSARGSDCGIANVNVGTSGAEIGGAFGGDKDTGGGRESGSDAWKAYARRVTSTVGYGDALPLAQGVRFDLKG